MANNNNMEARIEANSAEIGDKALEAVSGGSIGIDIDRQKLMDMNKEAEILGKLENTSAQNDLQKTEGTVTDLTGSLIVHSGKAPSQEEINSFLDTLL